MRLNKIPLTSFRAVPAIVVAVAVTGVVAVAVEATFTATTMATRLEMMTMFECQAD